MFGLGALTFAVGWGSSRWLSPEPAPPTPVECEAPDSASSDQATELKSKIEALIAQSNGDNPSRLLGQMVLILLADLGIRSQTTAEAAKALTSKPPRTKDAPKKVAKKAPPKSDRSTGKESAPRYVPWGERESGRIEIGSRSEANEFLDRTRETNLSNSIRKTLPLEPEVIQLLNGRYSGSVTPIDPAQVRIQVNLEINARLEGDRMVGEKKVTLRRDGEVFSRGRGSGNLADVFQLPGGSEAVWVGAGNGDILMQLYRFPGMEHAAELFGNYYEKKNLTDYEVIGRVQLRKIP
jgi:hypothetical protein